MEVKPSNYFKKKAIVIGATGLIGKDLIKLLLNDDEYGLVKVFSRRPTGKSHQKLKEYIVDFDNLKTWQDELKGDVLFSALGSTRQTAGSKEAQYKVDYTYQYNIAKAAAQNRVRNYILVSTAGAHPTSKLFYTRIKGELEEAVKALPFEHVTIFRPSILIGVREKERTGEKIGVALGNALVSFVAPLKKYRPIPGHIVAEAMINSFKNKEAEKVKIYDLDEIFSV